MQTDIDVGSIYVGRFAFIIYVILSSKYGMDLTFIHNLN